MLLLVVIRSRINVFTGTLFLFLFFLVAVLIIYLSLTSFYKNVSLTSSNSGVVIDREAVMEEVDQQ